jgi:flagellar biogenesis protein FliO
MPNGLNRKAFILAAVAAAGLALFMFVPSMGTPQRNSAFDDLADGSQERAAVSTTPVTGTERDDADVAPVVGSAIPGFSAGDMLGLAVRLLIVGAIIAGSLFLLRVYGHKLRSVQGSTGIVRVLDTLGLANGRAIYVLDAGEKVLLVGATQTQISYLGEITGKDSIAALRTASELPPASGAGLWDSLRGLTNRISTPPSPPAAGDLVESATIRRLMESQEYLRARLDEVQRRHDYGGAPER